MFLGLAASSTWSIELTSPVPLKIIKIILFKKTNYKKKNAEGVIANPHR